MAEGVNTLALANYNKGYVIYSVKVENKSAGALSDVRVKLFMTESIFKSDTREQAIALIKKGEASTVKFTLRPKNVCGIVEVLARVRYFDTASEKDEEMDVPRVSVEISCPELTSKKVDAETWEEKMGELMKVREEIQDIGMSPDSAFEVISESIKDMNMALVEKKEIRGVPASTYIGKFYGVSRAKGVPYGVKVEIMGETPASSRVNLTAYAQDEKTMCGCVHRMLDEVEARVRVKDRILFISQGDMVFGEKRESSTVIKDSVLSRTAIGPGEGAVFERQAGAAEKCPNPDCGNLITGENKALKCGECGKRFCTTCEGWIDKAEEFHGKKLKFSYPLCEECYVKSLNAQQKEIIVDEKKYKFIPAVERARQAAPEPSPARETYPCYAVCPGCGELNEAKAGQREFMCQVCGEYSLPVKCTKTKLNVDGGVGTFQSYYKFETVVENKGTVPVTEAALDLGINEAAFRLERIEPDLPRTGYRVQLGAIGPNEKKEVCFYLDPLMLTESVVDGVLTYKYEGGTLRAVPMIGRYVIMRPLAFSPSRNLYTDELRELLRKELKYRASKIFLVPEGLSLPDAFAIGKACVDRQGVALVREFLEKEPYKAESWYHGLAMFGTPFRKSKDFQGILAPLAFGESLGYWSERLPTWRMVIRVTVRAQPRTLEFSIASDFWWGVVEMLVDLRAELLKRLRSGVCGEMKSVTDSALQEKLDAEMLLLDKFAEG